ncbi:hypothetical protein A1355_08560 [Methylomonas koyamae]|uniref:Uncharacterized protein n=1 Tax=Methylomonas koyamae TaxID=702114 RepID=A0A177NJJ0_9GAMM|nr:hypothetical protein A1355_08560 [Methylomonas koyamae]
MGACSQAAPQPLLIWHPVQPSSQLANTENRYGPHLEYFLSQVAIRWPACSVRVGRPTEPAAAVASDVGWTFARRASRDCVESDNVEFS